MIVDTKVRIPHGRLRSVLCFSAWGDFEFQWQAWALRERVDSIWGTFYSYLGEVFDSLDLMPEPHEEPGRILASAGEVARVARLAAVMDPVTDASYVDYDKAETFLLDPRWPSVIQLSRAITNLLVLNGGLTDVVDWDQPTLVARPFLRGTAMQCLASIADEVNDPAERENAPHYRDFDTAVRILTNEARLTEAADAVGDVYREGEEVVRLQRLSAALDAGDDRAGVADLAAACMSAMVRAGGGWHYETD